MVSLLPSGPRPVELDVNGRHLRLSNLDKVLWPDTGFTKGQMIDFYVGAAPWMLPHLAGRPVTMARFPDGVDGPGWYQTSCHHHPPWMETVPVPSPQGGGPGRNYCLVNDLAALLWIVNQASIEVHPLLARAGELEHPTAVVFDLDPGRPAGIPECCRVALWVRQVLEEFGLASFAKTSGVKGLHIYVPLGGGHTYPQTKSFARAVARRVAEKHPGQVVDRMEKRLREGKVLIDWNQNDASKSLAAPYSMRARRTPCVSTPVAWSEIEAASATSNPADLTFEPRRVLDRLSCFGDLFGPVLDLEQTLFLRGIGA